MIDPIVAAVRADLLDRSVRGVLKYGCTLARADLSRAQWARHLYEELLDAALYARRLVIDLEAAAEAPACAPSYPVRAMGAP